jgi:predicted metal-dependent peptidase
VSPSASAPTTAAEDALQLKRIARGLRLLTVPLPYLSGLAAAVRFSIDNRVPTMGVFASGRLVANAQFTAKLNENELIFVLAHELLHLALRTHDRARGSHHLEFNYAHDYIINDILRGELGFQTVPAGGLDMPGARDKAAEEIVLDMRRNANNLASRTAVFGGKPTTVARVFGLPGQGRGNSKPGDSAPEAGDVLDERKERELFPADIERRKVEAEAIRETAAKGLALAKAIGALKGVRGVAPGTSSQVVTALRGIYRTPWETALQRWLDSVAPGDRTFTRASRRGAERTDIVMPGRRREGWVLNVVLDTSGSMDTEIPRALGAIADFCDASGVDEIRLLQCDADVTGDDRLSPSELTRFQVSGYGGSDLSPALERLAADPQVKAAAVITDGDIAFPEEPLPYDVLWILTPSGAMTFRPRYGRVVVMQPT